MTTEADMSRDRALMSGQIIHPIMTQRIASQLVRELYGLKVHKITELNSYYDRNYKVDVRNEDIDNANIKETWPHGYILKVLNSWDSHIDAEHEVQKKLHEAVIACPQSVLDKQGREYSLQKIHHEYEVGEGQESANIEYSTEDQAYGIHIVRLLTFIPGQIIACVPHSPELYLRAGQMLGKIDTILQGYSHPALTSYRTIWHTQDTGCMREYLHAIEDQSKRDLFNSILESYDNIVVPLEADLRKGVIHGDFSDRNVLVHKSGMADDCSDEYCIAGVIDFGEMTDSFYLFEVANAFTYMSINSSVSVPLDVGGYILAGYTSKMPLNCSEWRALKECVCIKICITLLMGHCANKADSSNIYALTTAKKGWDLLRRIWETPKRDLYLRWQRGINKMNPSIQVPRIEDIV